MTQNSLPRPAPGIMEIEAYVPGDSGKTQNGRVIKLSSNETPLGPSPAAITAYQEEAGNLAIYPDGSATKLRQAIAARYGLNPDNLVCGAGSDELLNLLAQAYITPGDEGIYSKHGFLVYKIAILTNGGTPMVTPESNLMADVDAILSAVTGKTKIVFLANPNNPTGTYLPIEEVRRLREGLPDHVVLVLDAAYAEYVRRNDYEAGIELVSGSKNTVMTRTFSKIFGLAGLRLGWAYCPDNIADTLNRIRGPFNLTTPAISAGIAAINDRAHVEQAFTHNETWRTRVAQELEALGLEITPSVANFLLIHFDAAGKEKSAERADQFLNDRGIILRPVGAYGFPNALRMTIGTESENLAVLAAFKDFFDKG